jgi:AcrR family transcriptional regulator
MSDTATLTKPRKRDAEATRAAILGAAKVHFARSGYQVALRDIASEAGADVALVQRYFGSKEGLFTEALKASFRDDPMREWDRQTFAREFAVMMADNLDPEEDAHSFQFLLRAATTPATAPLLSVALQERFLRPIREWLGGEDTDARARVLAATVIGFLVERLLRDKPLVGVERETFIERATKIFQTIAR